MAEDPIRRARSHEAAGRIDDALAAYREVGMDAPSYGESRIRIVGILLLRGNAEEAEREAKAFVERKPQSAEAHATLGQVLRLGFRYDAAVETFKKAAALAPSDLGMRALLMDALRSKYWSADPDLYYGMKQLVESGAAGPAVRYRYFHCLLVGILNPELQRWLVDARRFEAEPVLPPKLKSELDARFGNRFTLALDEVIAAWKANPYGAVQGRVTLTDRSTMEGLVEDLDTSIGGALEQIHGEEFGLVPFEELKSIELETPAIYTTARITPKSGPPKTVSMPSLYFFTEGCRVQDLRLGKQTVWRTLGDELRLGLGLRELVVGLRQGGRRIPIHRIQRVDFS